MHLPKFEYIEPKTLKAAINALSSNPKGAFLLAGGTDLLVNMKHGIIRPDIVINIKKIPGLNYISDGKDGLRIGSIVTLHDLASSQIMQEKYPAISQAAREVGAYSHQVMGTIGGNLCQGNRCRFYNQSILWRSTRPKCYKAGGDICHVVKKPRQCYSAYCGDMAPVLIALDAKIKLVGPDGTRDILLKRLYKNDGKRPLSLHRGEILKEIILPPPSGKTIYLKWRMRNSIEFPIVSLALHIDKDERGKIEKIRIIFSGVGPGPVEALKTERMIINETIDNQLIEKISKQAIKEISPMRTSIYSPSYKRKMAGILLKQALERLR